jgi:hypothetical protein
MPRLHILSNERVEKLARITQLSPRQLGYWHIYWTSPELSQDEVERLQLSASRVLDADSLREGAYAVAPSEVQETLTAILAGEAVPRPDPAPAPMPSWLQQVDGLTG